MREIKRHKESGRQGESISKVVNRETETRQGETDREIRRKEGCERKGHFDVGRKIKGPQ